LRMNSRFQVALWPSAAPQAYRNKCVDI